MASPSSSLHHGGYSGYSNYNSEAAQQAALYADMFTLKCETGFFVLGLQDGEAIASVIRLVCTLVTASVASAWFSRRKAIGGKLLLFFSHWLSGLLYLVALMIEANMVSLCWTGHHLETFIKTIKFLELCSANMMAITNLAIAINLALIVKSHRTMSTVKSISSPWVILVSLAISGAAAASSVPFWETAIVTPTTFWPVNLNDTKADWIDVSFFFVGFVAGVFMLAISAWLVLFCMKELRDCWKVHSRIRYYFILTLIGAVVNLAVGISGMVYVKHESAGPLVLVLLLSFRLIHIALDTVVLYGVLAVGRSKNVPDSSISSSRGVNISSGPAGSRTLIKLRKLSGQTSRNQRVSPQNSLVTPCHEL